jgi:SAM-dependent methyltransferase
VTTFDPNRYKTTTRQQWEDAAEAWHRWGPTLETWLGEATEQMLDMAGVSTGSRVLDVAAGAGGQTLAAARRATATGCVMATDISPTILTYAAKTAADAGLTNVQTRELDGERLDELPAAHFDAAICRLGLIYFPDRQRALTGIRRVLRPGGRVAAIVYTTADRNAFFSLPVSIIRQRAELPPPAPGQPGPFSLGDRTVIEATFAEAGFDAVTIETIAAPLRLATAADCARFERESFGALHQMLTNLPPDQRPAVWQEIETELARFEVAGGFVGPCELHVASATR